MLCCALCEFRVLTGGGYHGLLLSAFVQAASTKLHLQAEKRFEPHSHSLNPDTQGPVLQVLPKSQLPLLTSAMMVTQAFLAAPAGLAAKKSLGARNRVILVGYAAMIAADLSFALLPSVIGER